MAKGKKKKQNPRSKPPAASAKTGEIRLSQCMIVKNEEKNIEKALSWGKDIMYEQIVVDTGSTDRTVEIAERMGAKIYHFEWINDFAAAKNYAIKQASGDWIAFLDADEYFPDEDVPKLLPLVAAIDKNTENYNIIGCKMIHLNDDNNPSSTHEQDRIFKNSPNLYYKGRIHEKLVNPKKITISDITIIHTGYKTSAIIEKNKLERNISMLRIEQENDSDNPETMVYLADALHALGDRDSIEEALTLYRKALDSNGELKKSFRWDAYKAVIVDLLDKKDNPEQTLWYINKAIEEHPESVDMLYYKGQFMLWQDRQEEAWELYTECEKLMNSEYNAQSQIISKPSLLFTEMAVLAQKMDKLQETVSYAALTLKYEKKQPRILAPLIQIMLSKSVSEDEILGFLGKIYDFSDAEELVFLARTAKEAGAIGLAQRIVGIIRESGLLGGGQQ